MNRSSTDCHLPASNVPLQSLTPTENDVLSHLLVGFSNKEIATALGKAEPTVKHQVSSILRKFRQPSRARLIAMHRF